MFASYVCKSINLFLWLLKFKKKNFFLNLEATVISCKEQGICLLGLIMLDK